MTAGPIERRLRLASGCDLAAGLASAFASSGFFAGGWPRERETRSKRVGEGLTV
jgi:hypothetical protein